MRLRVGINFMMIGFAYFIRRDVTLGICFYYFVYMAYQIVSTLMGGGEADPLMSPWSRTPTTFSFQGLGAFIALVVVGLWNARRHIVAVLRRAVGLPSDVDDSEADEIMSYRAAVVTLVAGLVGMVGWLWLMGTKLWVGAVFVGVAVLIFIGITRVVCEAGLAAVRSPMIAPDLMIHGLGSNLIGAGGVFNLSLAYIWAADIRIFIMALIANGLKLVEHMDRRSRRMVLWGVYLAILIGAAGSCWMVLHITYRHLLDLLHTQH